MIKLKSFGSYVFENVGQSYADNFNDLVPKTNRLPGMDGGYPEFGTLRPPQESGSIQWRGMITANTPAELQSKLDTLRALKGMGMQPLFAEFADGAATFTRYCYAVINSLQISMDVKKRTRLFQPVQIVWQVAFPRWMSLTGNAEGAALWGDGSLWGGGADWGGTAASAISGTSTPLTIVNGGNAPVVPGIFITANAGLGNPVTIQRKVGIELVDEVVLAASLSGSQSIWVDCPRNMVFSSGVGAYSILTARRFPWFTLEPGSNSITVTLPSGGNSGYIKFMNCDAWY